MHPTEKKSRGSSKSVEAMIEAHDRELYRFLLHRLRNSGENPEDVRQEIYLRILRFTDAELVENPRAYLYRIARHVLADKLLLAKREPVTNDYSEIPAKDDTAQVDFELDFEYVLSQLPPLHRILIVLRKREGLSYSEIAKKQDLSVHTVKKYIHLAMEQMRAIGFEMRR